jgi:hypothetical protein
LSHTTILAEGKVSGPGIQLVNYFFAPERGTMLAMIVILGHERQLIISWRTRRTKPRSGEGGIRQCLTDTVLLRQGSPSDWGEPGFGFCDSDTGKQRRI